MGLQSKADVSFGFYCYDTLCISVRFILNLIALFFGWLYYPSKQRYLPNITDDILLQSASSLANLIKAGKLKSSDVVRAYIVRCKAVNPHLNAIVDDNFDEALKEAYDVDDRVKRELAGQRKPNEKSIYDYPFLGVPFTTKNSIAVKGKKFSAGLMVRKNVRAQCDSVVIDRMKRKGGAIFLALTNIPEIVMWINSDNKLDGRTNNPYDMARTSGGSSGGEGALISAAGSVIGIGSDIAGSIRIPSHFCGIFGHKTTPGVITFDGNFPSPQKIRNQMASLGPMCRYVTDLRPMLKVLSDGKLILPDLPLDYSNLTVYYFDEIGDPLVTKVDNEIKTGLQRAVKYLISNGAYVKPLDTQNRFYNFRYAMVMWEAMMKDDTEGTLLDALTNLKRETINPYIELIKCMFGINKQYTAPILIQGILEEFRKERNEEAFNMLTELRNEVHSLLENNGVILTPTLPEIAFKHNQTMLKCNSAVYTSLWNTMKVAVTTVPLGLDRHGMPYSIQAIVSPNNDNLSIQISEELTKHFGGWAPPCLVTTKK